MKKIEIIYLCISLLVIQSFQTTFAQQTGKWGDQGDGTFRNPVIAADFSDPDPVRVGDDYYMAASTFERIPGVSILHSKDLVNWQMAGGVFNNLDSVDLAFHWTRMKRYTRGVYAPSLRYHDGKFWVFVNLVTDGFFVATAEKAEGPWTIRRVKDKNGKPLTTARWTDPCPFWDEDGKAYLACSKVSNYWYSYLFQMSPDGSQLIDADIDHMNKENTVYQYPDGGTLFSPNYSSEGNKIYKRNGYYYIVHIQFIGDEPGTYIYRSRNLFGTKSDGTPGKPGDLGKYEIRRTDRLVNVTDKGYDQEFPGQGGFVDTPDGRWFYIAQFNRYSSDGRTPCLVPVTWVNDWPVLGVDIDAEGYGKMVWQLKKPIPSTGIKIPHGSDDFTSSQLNPFWSWNHQPNPEKWSLTERPGYMRLYASNSVNKSSRFFRINNVLNQRHMRSDTAIVTIKLDISGMVSGQTAGLAHYNDGRNYSFLAVSMNKDTVSIVYKTGREEIRGTAIPTRQKEIYIRSTAGFDNKQTYQYSTDGKIFHGFGDTYELVNGLFSGDMVGVFTYNNEAEAGYIDLDSFEYIVVNR